MNNIANREAAEEVLTALGEQLATLRESYELVVVGGSGLLVLGAIERATRDVDVVALRSDAGLENPDPLPKPLRQARDRVARDFSLPQTWLNAGPASLLDFQLPTGFLDRVESHSYGEHLTVHFASRLDQIHFKLYAAVDAGPGKHSQDLEALTPTAEELLQAAQWTRTHDPSPGFEEVLRRVLAHYGVDDADF
ncbi:MAG TPA: DUF6036 family nucleotidyltransferase [Solirubrobacterales bacterium]|nr:DUF6036 family nucleotidyltransferase [Solirubrobacterales bacterium]